MENAPKPIPEGPLCLVVLVYTFVGMSNTMDANDTTAIAYPFLECVFLRFVEENPGVVVENNDIYIGQASIREKFAVAGLREVPAFGFGQFGK